MMKGRAKPKFKSISKPEAKEENPENLGPWKILQKGEMKKGNEEQ
jgi:hypothetical protein